MNPKSTDSDADTRPAAGQAGRTQAESAKSQHSPVIGSAWFWNVRTQATDEDGIYRLRDSGTTWRCSLLNQTAPHALRKIQPPRDSLPIYSTVTPYCSFTFSIHTNVSTFRTPSTPPTFPDKNPLNSSLDRRFTQAITSIEPVVIATHSTSASSARASATESSLLESTWSPSMFGLYREHGQTVLLAA